MTKTYRVELEFHVVVEDEERLIVAAVLADSKTATISGAELLNPTARTHPRIDAPRAIQLLVAQQAESYFNLPVHEVRNVSIPPVELVE